MLKQPKALYVTQGFIVRFDSHPDSNPQIQGVVTEFNPNNNSYLLILITESVSKHYKIAFIHVDDSINLTHIQNEIKTFSPSRKYIVFQKRTALMQAENLLAELFPTCVKLQLPERTRELYLHATDGPANLKTMAAGLQKNIFILNADNCGSYGIALSLGSMGLRGITRCRHPQQRMIETFYTINEELMSPGELKALSHHRVIFNFNHWCSIAFERTPLIQSIIDVAATHTHLFDTIKFISRQKQLTYQSSAFLVAVSVKYLQTGFDVDALFCFLIATPLDLLIHENRIKLKNLPQVLEMALQNPASAYETLTTVHEINDRKITCMNVSDVKSFFRNCKNKDVAQGLLRQSMIAYIKTIQLLYLPLKDKDIAVTKAESVYQNGAIKEKEAQDDSRMGRFSEANTAYRAALNNYQLICSSGHWVSVECRLAYMRNQVFLFFLSASNEAYEQVKSCFEVVMLMKTSEAHSHRELLPMYALICLLVRRINYKSKNEEIKFLELIMEQWMSHSAVRVHEQWGSGSQPSTEYRRLLAAQVIVDLQREVKDASKILGRLLYHCLTRGELEEGALQRVVLYLTEISFEHFKKIWFELFGEFTVSFANRIPYQRETVESQLQSFFYLLYHFDAFARISFKHEDFSLIIKQQIDFLIIKLLKDVQWATSADSGLSETELMLMTVRRLQFFCRVMATLYQDNGVSFELFRYLPKILQLFKDVRLLKDSIETFTGYLEEKDALDIDSDHDMIRDLWGYIFYVIFAEMNLSSLPIATLNQFFEMTGRFNVKTNQTVYQSFKACLNANAIRKVNMVTDLINNARYLQQCGQSGTLTLPTYQALVQFLFELIERVSRIQKSEQSETVKSIREKLLNIESDSQLQWMQRKFKGVQVDWILARNNGGDDLLPSEEQSRNDFFQSQVEMLRGLSVFPFVKSNPLEAEHIALGEGVLCHLSGGR